MLDRIITNFIAIITDFSNLTPISFDCRTYIIL